MKKINQASIKAKSESCVTHQNQDKKKIQRYKWEGVTAGNEDKKERSKKNPRLPVNTHQKNPGTTLFETDHTTGAKG